MKLNITALLLVLLTLSCSKAPENDAGKDFLITGKTGSLYMKFNDKPNFTVKEGQAQLSIAVDLLDSK